MAKIRFENGVVVNFDGTPTQKDVEEVAAKLGISKTNPATESSIPGSKILQQDILGNSSAQDHPIIGPLIKNTVGANSFTGLAALPGRLISAAITKDATGKLIDSKVQLAQSTAQMMDKARKLAPGPQRDQLLQIAKENYKILGQSDEQIAALTDFLPKSAAQPIGMGANAALTAATLGAGSVAPRVVQAAGMTGKAAGALNLGIRSLEGAALGGGFQASTNVAEDKNIGEGVGTSALIGAAIPIATTALSKGVEMLGNLAKTTGQKIQMSKIKPSIHDVKDGFKIENVSKYDVGGSLAESLVKTNERLNTLNSQLKTKLARSPSKIDLRKIYDETVKQLQSNKLSNFGDNGGIERQLNALQEEIAGLGSSKVDLPTAQVIKRSAGTKGSWVFGRTDPDAKANEIVYNTFYNRIKGAIEKASPEGVRDINKAMSDLIPIHNAILRRLPVEERNNAIGLIDAIGMFEAFANPKALLAVGLNKALKSGRVGSALVKAGTKLSETTPSRTNIGTRLFGR